LATWTNIVAKVLSDLVVYQDINELAQNAVYIQEDVLGNPADNSGAVNFANGGVTISHANGLTVSNDAQFDKAIPGFRNILIFAPGQVFGYNQDIYIGIGETALTRNGAVMPRAGSIVAASYCWRSTSYSSDITFTPRVQINTTNAVSLAAFTITANGITYSDSMTQARGIDTFSAGDQINLFLDRTSAGGLAGGMPFFIVEVVFDT